MASFNSFEEIQAWQKARELCRITYRIIQEGSLARDFKLVNQINGSSGSIMDNIAEGFERNGSNEFHSFWLLLKGQRVSTDLRFTELLTEITFQKICLKNLAPWSRK